MSKMKKKKGESIPTIINPYAINSYESVEITTLNDSFKRYMSLPSLYDTTSFNEHVYSYPYTNLDALKRKRKRKELEDVDISSHSVEGGMAVTCDNQNDLSTDKILKTLSLAKGRLMLDMAAFSIQEIECSMTPSVKKNIITASKKLKMYGKKLPIVACFDDYGNRLSDKIELDRGEGVSLNILSEEIYGKWYLEIKAIAHRRTVPTEWLPFF